MRLEELSDKELAVLELLANKDYGVRFIAKTTGTECRDVFKIMGDIDLLREYRGMKKKKEKEREETEKGVRLMFEEQRKRKRGLEEQKRKLEKEKKIEERKKRMRGVIKRREDIILEAICEKGCRSIKVISNTTKISYPKVQGIVSEANLLEDLREMREKEDYEKIKYEYKKRVSARELAEKTGILGSRIFSPLKKIKKELNDEQRNLSSILHQIIFERAKKEDPALYYTYIYSNKPYVKLSFKEIYKRSKDIYDGYTVSECARRWGIKRQGASQFTDWIGMRKIHREKVNYLHY